MARVLLVDDEPGMIYALRSLVTSRGDEAVVAASAREALGLLDDVDAVVTDFAMPEMNGLELLQAIRAQDPALPVILLTAHGSERVAIRAVRSGAYEYVTKPFDIDEMSVVLDRALEARALRLENRRLSGARVAGGVVVGESGAMRRLLDFARRVAPKDVTVLVRGETGTGKELVASLLHAHSRRAERALIRFNCAAIPPDLAEAELFGHARGAFTGAIQARRGFFARADGGTLLLDEVGELPLPVQAKLLRALQEGELQPLGAGQVEHVDVRVIASTNRDLAEEVKAGRFREDLYYRLAVVELVVPPLREHREDIPALVRELARRYAERFGMEDVRLAPELVERLARAEWPGNVRQLENCVARMLALSSGGELGASALACLGPPSVAAPGVDSLPPGDTLTLREQVEALERNLVMRTLSATSGNQSEAARRLGISRSALIDRINKYGLAT